MNQSVKDPCAAHVPPVIVKREVTMTTGFNSNKITVLSGDETGAVWRDKVLEALINYTYMYTSGTQGNSKCQAGGMITPEDIAPPKTNLQLFFEKQNSSDNDHCN